MSAETPDINDPRIARARAMRQAGAETAEIARACGVGVSTIYRWAEAYGFRVCDLEAAAWAASGRGDGAPSQGHSPVYPVNPCRDLSSTQPEWIPRTGRGMTEGAGFETPPDSPDHVRGPSGGERVSPPEVPDAQSASRDLPPRLALPSDGGPGAGPGIQVGVEGDSEAAEITPAQWAAMARGLKQRALRLTEAGRLRQAEQALRLAERYERMQSGAAPAPKAAEEDDARYYDELDARLDRLAAHLRAQAGLKADEEFSPAHRAALGLPPRPEDGAGEAGRD